MEAEEIRAHGIRDPKDLDAQPQTGTSGYVTGSEVSQLEISSRAGRPDNSDGIRVNITPGDITSCDVDPGANISSQQIVLTGHVVQSTDTHAKEHEEEHNSTAGENPAGDLDLAQQFTQVEVRRQISSTLSNDDSLEDTGPGRVSLDSGVDGAPKNIAQQDGQAQSNEHRALLSQPQSCLAARNKKKQKIIDGHPSSVKQFTSVDVRQQSTLVEVRRQISSTLSNDDRPENTGSDGVSLDSSSDGASKIIPHQDGQAQSDEFISSAGQPRFHRAAPCKKKEKIINGYPSFSSQIKSRSKDYNSLEALENENSEHPNQPPTSEQRLERSTSLALSDELIASDPNITENSSITEENFNNFDGPDGPTNGCNISKSPLPCSRFKTIPRDLLTQKEYVTPSYQQRIETRRLNNINNVIPHHQQVSKVKPSSDGYGDGFTPKHMVSSETADYFNKINAIRLPTEKIGSTSADSPIPEEIFDPLEDEGIVSSFQVGRNETGDVLEYVEPQDSLSVGKINQPANAARGSELSLSGFVEVVATIPTAAPGSVRDQSADRSSLATPTTSNSSGNIVSNTSLRGRSLSAPDPDPANHSSIQLQRTNSVPRESEVSQISSFAYSACVRSAAAFDEDIVFTSNLDVEATNTNTVNMLGDDNLMDRTNSHKTKFSQAPLATVDGPLDSPNDRALNFPHDQMAPDSRHSTDPNTGNRAEIRMNVQNEIQNDLGHGATSSDLDSGDDQANIATVYTRQLADHHQSNSTLFSDPEVIPDKFVPVLPIAIGNTIDERPKSLTGVFLEPSIGGQKSRSNSLPLTRGGFYAPINAERGNPDLVSLWTSAGIVFLEYSNANKKHPSETVNSMLQAGFDSREPSGSKLPGDTSSSGSVRLRDAVTDGSATLSIITTGSKNEPATEWPDGQPVANLDPNPEALGAVTSDEGLNRLVLPPASTSPVRSIFGKSSKNRLKAGLASKRQYNWKARVRRLREKTIISSRSVPGHAVTDLSTKDLSNTATSSTNEPAPENHEPPDSDGLTPLNKEGLGAAVGGQEVFEDCQTKEELTDKNPVGDSQIYTEETGRTEGLNENLEKECCRNIGSIDTGQDSDRSANNDINSQISRSNSTLWKNQQRDGISVNLELPFIKHQRTRSGHNSPLQYFANSDVSLPNRNGQQDTDHAHQGNVDIDTPPDTFREAQNRRPQDQPTLHELNPTVEQGGVLPDPALPRNLLPTPAFPSNVPPDRAALQNFPAERRDVFPGPLDELLPLRPRLDPYCYHAHLTDARDTDLAYEMEHMPPANVLNDDFFGAQGGGNQPVLDSASYPITDADALAETDNPVLMDTPVHYGSATVEQGGVLPDPALSRNLLPTPAFPSNVPPDRAALQNFPAGRRDVFPGPLDELLPLRVEDIQVGGDVLQAGEQPRLDPYCYHTHLTDARDTDLAYEMEHMPPANVPNDDFFGAQGGGDQPVLDSASYPITDADALAETNNPVLMDTPVHYGPGQDEIRTLVAAGDTLELRRSLRRLGLDGPHLILFQGDYRSNALHIAVQHGYLRCLEVLLQALNPYSTLPSALRARDGQGRTPLQQARALHRAPQIITALMAAMTKCGITEPV